MTDSPELGVKTGCESGESGSVKVCRRVLKHARARSASHLGRARCLFQLPTIVRTRTPVVRDFVYTCSGVGDVPHCRTFQRSHLARKICVTTSRPSGLGESGTFPGFRSCFGRFPAGRFIFGNDHRDVERERESVHTNASLLGRWFRSFRNRES